MIKCFPMGISNTSQFVLELGGVQQPVIVTVIPPTPPSLKKSKCYKAFISTNMLDTVPSTTQLHPLSLQRPHHKNYSIPG